MSKWQSTIRWVPVVVALLAAGPATALADSSADEGYRVLVSDLDLQSASGVSALYSRLQAAARAVCGFDQAHGYAERRRARQCVNATLDAVVAEVAAKNNLPGLFAAHRAGRNGPTIRESRLVAEYRLP